MTLNLQQKKDLIAHLSLHATKNKIEKILEVSKERTRYLTLVLEDIYQAHNASAVVRTCDVFGIQDLYIVEQKNMLTVNDNVALGSTKWVDLKRYNAPEKSNIENCILDLKKNGYKIVATTPHTKDCNLSDLKIDQKTALLFGTEETGLTEKAISLADEYVKIPMYGFSESLNISVCAAICLYDLTSRMRKEHRPWQFGEEELIDLQLDWFRKVVVGAAGYEKLFFKSK
ncbi:MAG: tRNA/rRNA methyltransferase (SpoU) [candidate division TM6 bacterium GW2011_GWF2_32_72]|nr:MAG: tRNA/rRNA methyltransferase (SpoU) [candidate division TM6 bacterium GW2011_GWF2_32_72]